MVQHYLVQVGSLSMLATTSTSACVALAMDPMKAAGHIAIVTKTNQLYLLRSIQIEIQYKGNVRNIFNLIQKEYLSCRYTCQVWPYVACSAPPGDQESDQKHTSWRAYESMRCLPPLTKFDPSTHACPLVASQRHGRERREKKHEVESRTTRWVCAAAWFSFDASEK